jgi:regulator of sigma E protease
MIIQILQFILGLSLLIVLHELGHFIPAIAFKTRVEKFYLFFDPWFSLVKTKIRGTEVGIGWLPLGGYVKIAGMVDESMDKDQMSKPPEPYEFRSKPAWQRLIILLGGVTVNFIVAIVIYSGMMAYYGDTYVSNESLKDGIWVNELGRELGLETGDRIIAIDGNKFDRFSDISIEMLLGSGSTMQISRENKIITLPITTDFVAKAIESKAPWMTPRIPYFVKAFVEGSPAEKAGILPGDKIISLNGQSMSYFDQYISEIPNFAGEEVTIGVLRADSKLSYTFSIGDNGQMGVYYKRNLSELFPLTTVKYSGFGAIEEGWNQGVTKLGFYIRQVKLIFTPETGAYKEAGGFIAIFQQYPTGWDWQYFWGFTAFLSLALGFLNILPIPALDGGHVVFVLIEMITGKALSTKVMENAQMIGFYLLFGLFLLVNGNDVYKLLFQ